MPLVLSREEWENRQKRWWGPFLVRSSASNKKGGRECRHKGDECVERAGVPAPPPSSNHQWCRGRRLRTAKKKERSLPAPLFDACPLTEGNRARV